jgi:hypothetical protein
LILARVFFDSSALVKLYHPETGTSAVDQIANTAGNLIRISRLTVAKLTSAFAIKGGRCRSAARTRTRFFVNFEETSQVENWKFSRLASRSSRQRSRWLSDTRSTRAYVLSILFNSQLH